MTPEEFKKMFKVGDEVLLRAEIGKILDGFIVVDSTPDISMFGGQIVFPMTQIYSFAPPFEIGEEIEVSDSPDFERYMLCVGVFTEWRPKRDYPYTVQRGDGNEMSYKYARKIQPATKPEVPEVPEFHIIDGVKYRKVEE